jgi:hypothetical protein
LQPAQNMTIKCFTPAHDAIGPSIPIPRRGWDAVKNHRSIA